MGYKLKLIKGRSYSGIITADWKNPVVEVKNKKEVEEAIITGYFELVEEAESQSKTGE